MLIAVWFACAPPADAPIDADRDGFAAGADCDDDDPFVFPGAMERCNGRDDDCDGTIDGDAAVASTRWYVDEDGDGFGRDDGAVVSCAPVAGRVAARGDCDDRAAAVNPAADDGCDGVDSDCDGVVDSNPDQSGFVDGDGDGYAGSVVAVGCLGVDVFAEATDCDDAAPAVFPGAAERCNGGVDDDCDGLADDADSPVDPTTWYADADLDGFGDDAAASVACEAPSPNTAIIGGDCDDLDASVYPGAPELCEPVDRDCDGALPGPEAWWSDLWPARIPVTVAAPGAADLAGAVVSVEVDVASALAGAPFDPRAVAVVVQDCAGGPRRIEATATDALGALFEAAPEQAEGDGRFGVHWRMDAPVPPSGAEVAIYLGGPIRSATGSMDVDASTLRWDLGFASVSDGLVAAGGDGAWVAADPNEGNGLRVDGAWPVAAEASVRVLADGAALGALAVERVDAAAPQQWLWFAFDGDERLFGRSWITVETDATIDDARPLQLVGVMPVLSTRSRGLGVEWLGVDQWAGAAWVDPPAVAGSACSGDACWLEGAERATPSPFVAGESAVDDRLLVLAWGDGRDADVTAARELPVVSVGAAEAR